MKEKKINQSHRMTFYVNEQEFKKLDAMWRATTCRYLSEYIRTVLFKKPLTATYRNRSMDELMELLIQLQNDLNALRRVHELEFQAMKNLQGYPEFQVWEISFGLNRESLVHKINEIKQVVQKMGETWLQ